MELVLGCADLVWPPMLAGDAVFPEQLKEIMPYFQGSVSG